MLSPFDLLTLSLVSDDEIEGENSTSKKTGSSNRVKVRVKGNRAAREYRDREIEGRLVAFDEHLNLVLLDCT